MLELKLENQKRSAKAALIFCILFLVTLAGCGSNPTNSNLESLSGIDATLGRSIHTFYQPLARKLKGNEPAIIQFIRPGGLAQKYGFVLGDHFLKINGKPISSSQEFQKRIKNIATPSLQIEYKSKSGTLKSKNVSFTNGDYSFGASTEIQNSALVKPGSSVTYIVRGTTAVYCSLSHNKDGNMLFVNLILESEGAARKTTASIQVYDTENKKLLGSNIEDAANIGGPPSLISRSFSVSDAPSKIRVNLVIEKQQFTFEFHN